MLRILGTLTRRCSGMPSAAAPTASSVRPYDFRIVETKWADAVLDHNLESQRMLDSAMRSNAEAVKKNKWYQLVMFPYPSGNLHMGHVRVYTISDAFARYNSMIGKYVMHPMGWDAFGLPAENAAILHNADPAQWTKSNIKTMMNQLTSLGLSFNYDTFATCDISYYKQTQRLFKFLFDKGLAYQQHAVVNWDPVDKTVLANEQVDAEGRSWRSGAIVEKRHLKQWFLRITDYAEDLLRGLDTLDWPTDVKAAQRMWIGKSEGHKVDFTIVDESDASKTLPLSIFTTRIDTLKHVDFLAISADHDISRSLGVTLQANEPGKFLGYYAHAGVKKIPVYVAAYVLADYGTGAIMGVPQFDERDAVFAKTMGIPSLGDAELSVPVQPQVHYKLRDWLISRQRYWGCPIPVVHCPKCGPVCVNDGDLPVPLPTKINNGPLEQDTEWAQTTCPCEQKLPAKRESDTMDTFVDSSFYFHRYIDPFNETEIVDRAKRDSLLPVDLYVGGKEHAVMHLLYSRFIHKVLMEDRDAEPFTRLLTQGMVLGKTRKTANSQRYLRPGEETKEEVVTVFEKMSKSKFNGISPTDLLSVHGADVLRLYTLFKAPPHLSLEWDEHDIVGMKRWLTKVWALVWDAKSQTLVPNAKLNNETSITIKHLEAVFEKSHSLNTAISGLMKLTNALQKASADCANVRADVHILVRLLVPFAPYFAHEAASVLGMPLKDVREWPQGQEITAAAKTLYVLQINGKTRDTFDVDEQVDDAQELAVTQVKDRFKDKTVIIKKIIQPAAAKIVNVICDVQE